MRQSHDVRVIEVWNRVQLVACRECPDQPFQVRARVKVGGGELVRYQIYGFYDDMSAAAKMYEALTGERPRNPRSLTA